MTRLQGSLTATGLLLRRSYRPQSAIAYNNVLSLGRIWKLWLR